MCPNTNKILKYLANHDGLPVASNASIFAANVREHPFQSMLGNRDYHTRLPRWKSCDRTPPINERRQKKIIVIHQPLVAASLHGFVMRPQ
jgi:hypothetical protein